MSTAAANGGDSVKGVQASSKQALKSGAGAGKALDGSRKQPGTAAEAQNRKPQHTPPARAWQGPNPIIQRAPSTAQSNGTDKPLPRLPPQQMQSKKEASVEKLAHDRLLWILANFTGMLATVTLKNGEQFKGLFSGASLDSNDTRYTLKMVKKTRLAKHEQSNGVVDLPEVFVTSGGEDHAMTFDMLDTADLFVPDVVTAETAPFQNGIHEPKHDLPEMASTDLSAGSVGGSFRTDIEISSRDARMPRERELQRWEAGPDDATGMSLESSSGGAAWDQFAANERMYGVQSTYDENIYTTAINRNDPEYKRKEAEAARIAREIEGSAPVNAHVAEERHRDAGALGDGADEEERFSGVKRDPSTFTPLSKGSAGSYVPPSRRPITSAPTVPGAPFDPAIISSQLAKPTTSPTSQPVPSSPQKTPEPAPIPLHPPVTEQPPNADDSKPKTSDGAPTAAAPAAEPPAKKPTENTAEDHVRSAADSFRQFANNEKLKIRQAQEQKRAHARNEKAVRLNDLKKFSLNFSLKSRVPDDLVPILAKDREKQLEIQRKAEDAARKEEERKRDEKDKTKSASPVTPSAGTNVSGTGSIGASATLQHRSRPSQQRTPGGPGMPPFPRVSSGQQTMRPKPLPEAMALPDGTKIKSGPVEAPPLSPSKRLNVNAFEFKPSAVPFQPANNSPSPARKMSASTDETASTPSDFFRKKTQEEKSRETIDTVTQNVIDSLASVEYSEEHKKKVAANGGVPFPYITQPTWPVPTERVNTSYQEMFPKSRAPSQGPSPMHTPIPSGHVPHGHQFPHQLQGTHMGTPQQQRFYPPHMDPRMQQYGPNGSVQSSPRFPPAQIAPPFNNQMPPMAMPQFAGQPMPGYAMSPSMQHRQLQGPPGAPMMMMPGQGYGQMPRPGQFPHMQPGLQQMPGAPPPMMHQQPNGPFMNGPMQQQSGFPSPMPHHAHASLQHLQQHGGPAVYTGSPRPPMMSHQGSHQGYNPQQMHMPQPHFGQPSPGHGGGAQLGYGYPPQRQMSNQGFPQATPRQQHAAPAVAHVPSPQQHGGMGGPQVGDEGK